MDSLNDNFMDSLCCAALLTAAEEGRSEKPNEESHFVERTDYMYGTNANHPCQFLYT
jgi:hypothetical protein